MKNLEKEAIKLRKERLEFINKFYKENNINQDWLSNGGRGHRDLYDDVCLEYPEFGEKVREYDTLINEKEEELGKSTLFEV